MPTAETMIDDELLDMKTIAIAEQHGCDRAVFAVCWDEHEKGLMCRCKEEARAELFAAHPQS